MPPCPACHCALLFPCTTVYVLDELVATLSAGDSRAAVDAVCARLAHRSPIVKQKVRWWLRRPGSARECSHLMQDSNALQPQQETRSAACAWTEAASAAHEACEEHAPRALSLPAFQPRQLMCPTRPHPPLLLCSRPSTPGPQAGGTHRAQRWHRAPPADGPPLGRCARTAALPLRARPL